jgi:hypothetical protein
VRLFVALMRRARETACRVDLILNSGFRLNPKNEFTHKC